MEQGADRLGLVADIGRHAVQFGLTHGGGEARAIRRFEAADHPTFTGALVAYLNAERVADRALPSALAVAGVARGDLISLTGSRWFISLSGIEAVLRARPRAVNECMAGAMALSALPAAAFRALTPGLVPAVSRGGAYLMIAPAAGLGVAALVSDGDRLVPVASEAAHMRFSPSTPDEEQLVARLRSRGCVGSLEEILAGEGLSAIHEQVTGRRATIRVEDLTGGGLRTPEARAMLDLYAGALGSAIGDLALAFGAWDGVFLTGPMLRALLPALPLSTLLARVQSKGPFRRQLSQLPLVQVLRDDLNLVGAAALLRSAGD